MTEEDPSREGDEDEARVGDGRGAPGPTMPWESTAPYAQEWTDQAYDDMSEGRSSAWLARPHGVPTLFFEGPCPRCRCDSSLSAPQEFVVDGDGRLGGGSRGVASAWHELPASCQCDGPHVGRPDGIKIGCGVSFTLLAREVDQ